jgi:DNA (cytosine-5)-methyltransferase 1
MNKLKVVSLFSGYGTQELALKYIGVDYENVANCDNFKQANECYDALHTTTSGNLGDITKVNENTFPQCDLLTYSFPCQDISISGVQKGIKEGTRSGLLYDVERLLSVNRPKYLLMENVKNLVSKNHIENFNKHIYFLRGLGYSSYWRVLNGADFGCPQNRERVFMMSVLNDTHENVKTKMLNVDNYKKTRVPMKPFIEDEVNENLFIECDYTPHTPIKSSICQLVGRRNDVKYDQARRIYSIEGCSPCLTTSGSPQIMTENGRVRYITGREGYRFMGVKEEDIEKLLSTSLSNTAHVSLAGNSICVPVMEAIFSEFFAEYITENKNKLSNQFKEEIND